MVASTGVAEVLLVLKIAFLVLLYLFVVRVIRSAGRERQEPSQDSMILTPAAAAAAGLRRGTPKRRSVQLVVRRSSSLVAGAAFPLNSAPLTLGRGGQNDLVEVDVHEAGHGGLLLERELAGRDDLRCDLLERREQRALGGRVHAEVLGRRREGRAACDGEIIEQADPENFFNNPRSDRTKLFLSQILK